MGEQLMEIGVDRIRPNPHQPRQAFDEAGLRELADSIQEHGVIEPLIVTQAKEGTFTLIAGERRWRAAQLAGLATVPVVVKPAVNDRTRLELALIENVQRQDLSVAEEARAYAQLAEEFGLSDEQIAQRVGKARSTVANVRRLATLPAPVLEKVGPGPGQISQNVARSLVVAAVHVKPKALISAAKEIVEALQHGNEEGRYSGPDPESIVEELVAEASVPMPNVRECWDLAWPGQTIEAQDQQGVFEIVACSGCPHFIQAARRCAWERCFTAKRAAWREYELERLVKKLGIPAAGADETVTIIHLEWRNERQVRAWVKKPPAHLRLIARVTREKNDHRGDDSYYTHERLGSSAVQLATVDPSALRSKDEKKKARTVVAENESPASQAKRLAQEEKERDERREERARQRKAMYDVDWLGVHTAQICASQVQASGSTLAWLVVFAEEGNSFPVWPVLEDAQEANEKARRTAKGKELETLQREAVLLQMIGHYVAQGYDANWQMDWPGAQTKIEEMSEAMGLKLPKGWNVPPVHRTDHNCHVCGRFTSQDHMTKRDEAEGWQIEREGKRVIRVTCSEKCRKATSEKKIQ
jgi:ParB/RepB/Spo0J family partition protein